MTQLPPLPRPISVTRDVSFIPVSADERGSFDLTTKVNANDVCQDCKFIRPVTLEPSVSTPDRSDRVNDGVNRETTG
jgi:hypothetical protein